MKKILLLFLFSTALCATEGVLTQSYYDYPLREVTDTTSSFTMTRERLQKWDAFLQDYFIQERIIEADQYRVYAYLYTAQRDAANLSYEITGQFVGSLDPINLAILQLFFPYIEIPFPLESDLFSSELAQLVLPHFKNRFLREEAAIKKVAHYLNLFYWTGKQVQFKESILGWIPWVFPSLATEKKEHIHSKPGVINWIEYTNHFLFSRDFTFKEDVLARSLVSIALYDAIITYTKLKYIYGVPKDENYLSLREALSEATLSLLDYLFPNTL